MRRSSSFGISLASTPRHPSSSVPESRVCGSSRMMPSGPTSRSWLPLPIPRRITSSGDSRKGKRDGATKKEKLPLPLTPDKYLLQSKGRLKTGTKNCVDERKVQRLQTRFALGTLLAGSNPATIKSLANFFGPCFQNIQLD